MESGCVKCGNFTLESGYEKQALAEHPDVDTLILCSRYHGSWSGKLAEGERISDSSTGSDYPGIDSFWEKIIEQS